MKKRKGFTLVELIASIAILAVILLMATISYTRIRKSILEGQYKNLKSVIEQSAVRYSSKTGYYAFFVQELIDDNNLETDDDLYIYDPRDNHPLNCHIVMIDEDKFGNLKATLQDDDHMDQDSNKCNINDLNEYPSRLLLRAYLNGTTIKYGEKNIGEASQTIFPENENEYPLVYNDWTRYDLDISADTSLITEDLTDARYVWNKNPEAYGETQVSITTSEQSIFDSYYYLDLYLNNNSHYQARLKYRFDREKPVIYHEKTTLSEYTPNDEWSRSKVVVLYVSDKDGVGLDRIYVGSKSCEEFKNDRSLGQSAIPHIVQTYTFTEPAGENGIDANVCAVDKLGNLADPGTIHISKVDRDAPTCEIGATGVEGNNGWFKKHPTSNTASDSYVRLSLSSNDGENGSGVAKYKLSASPLPTINITSNTASLNVTEDSPNKNGRTYYGYVIDAAGNLGRCERVIYRDTVAPSMTIKAYASGKTYDQLEELGFPSSLLTGTYTNQSTINFAWNNTGHRLIVTPSDALSGFSNKTNSADRNFRYSYNEAGHVDQVYALPSTYFGYNVIDGAETTNNFGVTSEGRRLVQFTLCDDAGNCRTSLITDLIDKTRPNVAVTAYDYKYAYAGGTNQCPDANNKCDYENTQTPVAGPVSLNNGEYLQVPWNTKGTYFKFSATDAASGVSAVSRRYNASGNLNAWNTNWTENGSTTYSTPEQYTPRNFWLSLTGKGKRMYQFDATDHAGNKTVVTGRTPISDGVACSLDVIEGTKGSGEWYKSSSVKLQLTIIGTDNSAITGVRITDSTTAGYDANTDANKVKTITANTSSNGKVYYGYVKTTVTGYTNVVCSITLYKDSTPPTCNYSPSNRTEWTRGYLNLKATCSDANSGCDDDYSGSSYIVGKNLSNGNIYNDTPTLEKYKFNTTIKDNAGNSKTCDQEINVLIDNTPPVIKQSSFAYNGGNPDYNNPIKNKVSTKITSDWNNEGHYYRYFYQDPDSGLASREHYINEYNTFGKVEGTNRYDFNKYNSSTGEFTGDPNTTTSLNGIKTEATFTNPLSSAGQRAQKIVIQDAAGNKASIISEDLIDKTAPSVNVKGYEYKGAPTSTGDCTGDYCNYATRSAVRNRTSDFTIDWNNKGHYYLVTPSDVQSGVKTVKWKYNVGGNYTSEGDMSTTSTIYSASCSSNEPCTNTNLTSTLSTKNTNLTSGGKRKGAFEVCDKAGNCKEITFTDYIDKNPPSAKITAYPYNGTYNSSTNNYSNITPYQGPTTYNNTSSSSPANFSVTGWKKDGTMFVTNYTENESGIISRERHINTPKDYSSYNALKDAATSTNTYNNVKSLITSLPFYSEDESSNGLRWGQEKVCDAAGNCAVVNVKTSVDTVLPSCTIQTDRTADYSGWYNKSVTLSFSSSSDNNKVSYKTIAASKTTPTSANNKSSLNVQTSSDAKSYWGSVIDPAGNINYCSKSIKVDINDPSCELEATGTTVSGVDGWYKSNVTVKFKSASDPTSGIDKYALSTSSSLTAAQINGASTVTHVIDTETSGTTIYGYVKDKAGRTGKCSITVKIDKTAPDLHIYIYNRPHQSGNTAIKDLYNTGNITYDWNNKGHVYTVKGYDTGVGLATTNNLRFRYNDEGNYEGMNDLGHETYYTITNNTTYTNDHSWYTAGGGQRKVEFRVCDKLNNCRTQYVIDKIDTGKPVCLPYILRGGIYSYYTSNVNSPNWSGQDLLFVSNCTDNSGSGIKTLLFTTGSFDVKTVNNPTASADGTVTESVNLDTTGLTGFGIYATDKAGNQSVRYCARKNSTEGNSAFDCTDGTVWNNHIVAIDKESPVSTMTSNYAANNGTYPYGTTFTFTCTDEESGVNTSGIKDGSTSIGTYVDANTKKQINYTISSAGTHVVHHTCKDNVANESTTDYTIVVGQQSSSSDPIPGGNGTCSVVYEPNGYPRTSSCEGCGKCLKPSTELLNCDGNRYIKMYGCNDGSETIIYHGTAQGATALKDRIDREISSALIAYTNVHYHGVGYKYYKKLCRFDSQLICANYTESYFRYEVRNTDVVRIKCSYKNINEWLGDFTADQGGANIYSVCAN